MSDSGSEDSFMSQDLLFFDVINNPDERPEILRKIKPFRREKFPETTSEDLIYDMSTNKLSIPIIHQVWIGPTLLDAAFILNESLLGRINNPLMYWVDFELMDKDERDRIRASNKNVIVMDVRQCGAFELVGSFYNVYIEYKAYNHLKEIFSLAVIHQYGGYFFDTTTRIQENFKGVKTMMPYDFFILPFADVDYDVYFYYSPKGYELTSHLLTFMINTYLLKHYQPSFSLGKYEDFIKLPYLIDYTKDVKENEWLMALTYYCAYGSLDIFNVFVITVRIFLDILMVNTENGSGRYVIKIPVQDHNRENYPDPKHMTDLFRIYNMGNEITIFKYFRLSGWQGGTVWKKKDHLDEIA